MDHPLPVINFDCISTKRVAWFNVEFSPSEFDISRCPFIFRPWSRLYEGDRAEEMGVWVNTSIKGKSECESCQGSLIFEVTLTTPGRYSNYSNNDLKMVNIREI